MVQESPAPIARTKAILSPVVAGMLWTLTHVDDFAFALVRGLLATFVTHPEREVYPTLQTILAKKPSPRRVKWLPRDGRYVVVSDHHLLYSGAPHDYFGGQGARKVRLFENERIYAQIMKHYAERGYTLVENGDVEDLVVPDPVHDRLHCLAEGAVGRVVSELQSRWNALLGRPFAPTMRENARKRQLGRIVGTYRSYYRYLADLFPDRIVKLIGNHDTELMRADFAALVPYGAAIHEFAVIEAGDDGPAVVICHGHQMDPWTCRATASEIGESITESFAWAGRGADRIWQRPVGSVAPTSDNVLSKCGFGAFDGWIPKVRHMSEHDMDQQLRKAFPGADRPWIVLGHTHEPRFRTDARYANAAAAGRYQDLVWAVEIVGGQPKLVVWWCEGDGTNPHELVFSEMKVDGEQLVCASHERHGRVQPLPYAARRALAEIDLDLGPQTAPSLGWMALRIGMHLGLLGSVVLGIGLLVRLFLG